MDDWNDKLLQFERNIQNNTIESNQSKLKLCTVEIMMLDSLSNFSKESVIFFISMS